MSPIKRVVLTTDLSDEATRAFEPALEIAKAFGARVELLHVVEDLLAVPHGAPLAPMQPDPSVAASREAAEKKLAGVVGTLGADAGATVLVAADVPAAIVAHAEKEPGSAICMSTHGRTGWRHLLLGSVTEQVLRQATMPVIAIPQKNPEDS